MAAADLESLCKEGRQFFRQGKYKLSIEAFNQAMKLDPDRVDVHEALATASFILKDYDAAIEHFMRVSQLRPMDAKSLINLGAVYNRKGEFQKGADVLKKALTRDKQSVEAYYNLGIAYRGLKQLPMAANSYKEALRLNPRMLDAMQNLGNVLLEMNNPKGAIEQYKKALEINPDFERAQRGLTRAEEVQNAAKANFNPFGRLVAEAPPPKQGATTIAARKLSAEERVNDRQVLRRISIELKGACELLFEHLRDEMEDDVTQLNRGVQTSTREVSKLLFSANEDFQAAFQRFKELRSEVKRLTAALAAHEATVKEPG